MLKPLNYKKLFLLDGVGAVVTALLLSQVLARFAPAFGMPVNVLHVLAGVAFIFAIYSFSCSLGLKQNQRPFLKAIALANLLYCLATLALVVYYWPMLTWLGIAYFAGEALIILALVRLELSYQGQ